MSEEVVIAQWDFGGQRAGDLPFKRHIVGARESTCAVSYFGAQLAYILSRVTLRCYVVLWNIAMPCVVKCILFLVQSIVDVCVQASFICNAVTIS